MSAPIEKPRTCSECVCFLVPARAAGTKSESWNCNPRGTRWHLTRRPDQAACGSVHAVKVTVADEWRQGTMTL
jgi:hypothetical protein